MPDRSRVFLWGLFFTGLILIFLLFHHVFSYEDKCLSKGGIVIDSRSGWICAKIEKL
jgi:hypothetical protein